MKYLVMVQGTQADYEAMRGKASADSPAWSEEELQTMFAYMGAINDDLSESGEFVDGQGLAEPAQARHVTLGDDGKAVITDGPYSETKELLAGYWVLECESLERVTEIADRVARCPQPAGARLPGRDPPDHGRFRGHLTTARCRRTRWCEAHPRSRTCCAATRRRYSARWSDGTGTSTPPRTPYRRRCSRPPGSGPKRACPAIRAAG
ncbi:hypothetical protein GCM10010228_62380 [Streptomyces massasporeus]|nr:hypothetical protein GCM10010228_62380 [Streptomyces massasporeus]